MAKLPLIAVALSTLIFAGLIPLMEINESHLFNSLWPAHARLHEAWQLLTNASLSALALWLLVSRKSVSIGLVISLAISISFLVAWALGNTYGGSMLHSDGTQTAVMGINLAVVIVFAVTTLLSLGLWAERR